MVIVKFTKKPDGSLWIGWADYLNGVYFASGHTLDNLVYRMKQCLYNKKRLSFRQVWLDTKPSTIDDVPVELMTPMFWSKYWLHGKSILSILKTKQTEKTQQTPVANATPLVVNPVVTETPKPAYDYYEYKVKDGHLIVYGVKRDMITSYDLRKNQNEGGNDDGE